MGLFKDMLSSDETLFKNEMALDFEFIPKLLPYRENQQHHIATCIKPLFMDRNGRNLIIHGAPGIGKTAATKWVFRDLEDETEDIVPLYVNCWKINTKIKIMTELCHLIGYKFTQNKRTDELFKVIKDFANKKSVVFAFDEVDKVEDFDFLYWILEEVYKKSVIVLTNYKSWINNLDERIKSRLVPEIVEFKQYNEEETRGILKQRIEYAFVPGVWENDAFELIVKKCAEAKDLRVGLYLMRESGLNAETRSSKKIIKEDAQKAIDKMGEFSIKNKEELNEDEKMILEIIKNNSNKKIGDLFKIFQEKGGKTTYKTFQRKIETLSKNGFISTEKTSGGKEGNTTIVSYEKKLTDFS